MTVQKASTLIIGALAVLIAFAVVFVKDDGNVKPPTHDKWIEWEYNAGVIAWKIFTGSDSYLATATYRTTVWPVSGQRSRVHCRELGVCGREVHVFIVGVRVAVTDDGKRCNAVDNVITHVLWKAY